jgi:RND superfamily putative drug exporter
VFLLSQVAQHHAQEESDRDAVRLGLALASWVMSAAALIMIAVFGSFVLNGDPTVTRFGVGVAVAVALAAGSVLLLTSAILVLLGRIAWRIPSFLEGIVPHVDIDGETSNRTSSTTTRQVWTRGPPCRIRQTRPHRPGYA